MPVTVLWGNKIDHTEPNKGMKTGTLFGRSIVSFETMNNFTNLINFTNFMLSFQDLKAFLDQKHDLYNRPEFIETDPIQVPHGCSRKEDIEIMAFLTTQIAWGNRKSIIKSAENIKNIMQNNPYEYITQASKKDFSTGMKFVHRTFNGIDLHFFLHSLQNIYSNHNGLEAVFQKGYNRSGTVLSAMAEFRTVCFELPHPLRTEKHISNVSKNSSAKRLNLFLMWMVRKDKRGVHFGIWNQIPVSKLLIPLDVHVGNTARSLGLLHRKQNDLKAVIELTENLKAFDPKDPVKYDFALFGTGVFEGIGKRM
jgi:uncharacterized protein (TIGR02757 family)